MGSLQIQRIANGIHLRLPRIDPSNAFLQLPQQKCGVQDLPWSPIFMPKYVSIGFEEFCFWYYFVLHLPWIDVVTTNVAETELILQGLFRLIFTEKFKISIALDLTFKIE